MKKLISVFLWVFFASAATAQTSGNATGNARAGILVPLSVEVLSNPAFGTFVAPSVDSVIRFTGSGSYIVRSGEAPQFVIPNTRGIWRVSGTPGASYYWALTSNGVLTSGGGDTLGYFALSCTQSSGNYRIIGANGIFDEGMCGQITLSANQAPGTYAGTYTLTVNYN